MPSLFENAVASIRMGVEDYRQQDSDRDVSAVRNFYAGVLLLAKEALIRKAPDADAKEVIGTSYKPVPDGDGGITFEAVGGKTIDFNTIAGRFKDFGMVIDHNALQDLNRIRNDMEHHYTDKTEAAVRTAIAKGFPVAASLFRQMDEDPAALLGDIWSVMLETRELYEHELKETKATLAAVRWYSSTVAGATLKCLACESELLEQLDPENADQETIDFRCRSCLATPIVADIIEATIKNAFAYDAYVRAKEGGEEGPVYQCPSCERDTYVEMDGICANCNESLDYNDECIRCSNGISIQEYLDGNDSGLCGYCSYVSDKVMRE